MNVLTELAKHDLICNECDDPNGGVFSFGNEPVIYNCRASCQNQHGRQKVFTESERNSDTDSDSSLIDLLDYLQMNKTSTDNGTPQTLRNTFNDELKLVEDVGHNSGAGMDTGMINETLLGPQAPGYDTGTVNTSSTPDVNSAQTQVHTRKLQKKIVDFFDKLKDKDSPTRSTDDDEIVQSANTEMKHLKHMDKLLRTESKRAKSFNNSIKSSFKAGTVWDRMDRLGRRCVNKPYSGQGLNIQDLDSKPVFIGGDVRALYPSMDQIATAEIAYHAVKQTKLKITGVDYRILSVYLLLTIGAGEMNKIGLGQVVPTRFRQENCSESLLSKVNKDMNYWYFPFDEDKLDERCTQLVIRLAATCTAKKVVLALGYGVVQH